MEQAADPLAALEPASAIAPLSPSTPLVDQTSEASPAPVDAAPDPDEPLGVPLPAITRAIQEDILRGIAAQLPANMTTSSIGTVVGPALRIAIGNDHLVVFPPRITDPPATEQSIGHATEQAVGVTIDMSRRFWTIPAPCGYRIAVRRIVRMGYEQCGWPIDVNDPAWGS